MGDGRWAMGDGRWAMGDGRGARNEKRREGAQGVQGTSNRGLYTAPCGDRRLSSTVAADTRDRARIGRANRTASRMAMFSVRGTSFSRASVRWTVNGRV